MDLEKARANAVLMLIKHIPKVVERGVLLRLIGPYLLWKDNTQASSKSKHALRLERDLPVPHLIFANWVDNVFLFHATVFSGCGPVAYAIRSFRHILGDNTYAYGSSVSLSRQTQRCNPIP